MQTPFFKLFVGPMFGSKTTKLLAEVDRLQRKSKVVIAVKPQKDDRYTQNSIRSHNGAECASTPVTCGQDVLYLIDLHKNIDVLAIDEAFMIPGIAQAAMSAFGRGLSIIVSSIQLDANLKPFKEVKDMMPWATSIEICPAICALCDNDAFYTKAAVQINEEPVIGGSDVYKPLCFAHMIQSSSSLFK